MTFEEQGNFYKGQRDLPSDSSYTIHDTEEIEVRIYKEKKGEKGSFSVTFEAIFKVGPTVSTFSFLFLFFFSFPCLNSIAPRVIRSSRLHSLCVIARMELLTPITFSAKLSRHVEFRKLKIRRLRVPVDAWRFPSRTGNRENAEPAQLSNYFPRYSRRSMESRFRAVSRDLSTRAPL